MADEKLLPCPYCGLTSFLKVKTNYNEAGNGRVMEEHIVRCDNCGAQGPTVGMYKTGAIKWWNTRKGIEK